MKLKGFWYDKLLVCLFAAFAAAVIVTTAFFKPWIALAELCAALVIFAIAAYRIVSAGYRYKKFMQAVSQKLDYSAAEVVSSYPFPVAVCDSRGYISRCNSRFINEIAQDELTQATQISDFINGKSLEDIDAVIALPVQNNDRYYSVFSNTFDFGGETYHILFWLDNTELRKTEIAYKNSRPYAILIELDNLDDSRSEFRDSERAEIKSRIDSEIDAWAESHNSAVRKISDDRYFIFTEKENFDAMTQEKFPILDTVREFTYKEKNIGATLSIGASGGDSLMDCEKKARKALEMALGRGGDQTAIKNKDGYEFYGGVSKSAEKRTKVKSRVVASALSELIKTSSNVIVMGHNFTDLDAIGSAIGVACAAKALGIPAYIVTDKNKTLARSLIDKAEAEGMNELFIDIDTALELMSKKTLTVVVDTHIDTFVEFPDLLEKAEKRVVIDHHRRSVADISNVVLFHHDPGASSASEMVTELLQYIGDGSGVSKTVAEALFAGIMLDTKNFVIRAGVRTFEAAAFLKDRGADTVTVKKLFSNSIEDNKLRNEVIANAQTVNSCAVSIADIDSPDIRIIAAQAADELLNVTDIKASFVIYETNGTVNVSARSFGEINVQLIMESLGGGGHQTMAACQLKDCTVCDAKETLVGAIGDFFEKYSIT